MVFIVLTAMQHRVPSPREIVMHAQTIMQNALIKKKLEEQRENYRKRQDQQQQPQQQHQAQQRASSPINSPGKQTMSPTPLAFTPTSVLRKMTADKEPEGANQSNHQLNSIFSFSSATNDNSNNYRNALRYKKNTDMQMLACSESAIQFTNHNATKHGDTMSDVGTLYSKSLRELNNNSNTQVEESALKAKYFSSVQHRKDTNNNSNSKMLEEKKYINESTESLNDSTTAKESALMNISDTINNSPLVLDKLLTEQFEIETIIVDDNKIIGNAKENKILNSQNDEILI